VKSSVDGFLCEKSVAAVRVGAYFSLVPVLLAEFVFNSLFSKEDLIDVSC
jgi:hypothetical protein